MDDEKELKKVLTNYHKKVINSSKNVLGDLREIIQGCKQKEYERIHFHFSGISKYIFGSVRSPVNANLRSSVCLFDESLSRALNLHLKAVWVSPRSVLGQS